MRTGAFALPSETPYLRAITPQGLRVRPCVSGVDDTGIYNDFGFLGSRNSFTYIRDLGLDTQERYARPYLGVLDGTWKEFFSSFDIDLQLICFESREQIREYIYSSGRDYLGPRGGATYFPLRAKQGYTIVRIYEGHIEGLYVHQFDPESHHKVIERFHEYRVAVLDPTVQTA